MPVTSSSTPPPESSPLSVSDFAPGTLIKIQSDTTKNLRGEPSGLLLKRDFKPTENLRQQGLVPWNSVLLVISKQKSLGQNWIELRVCTLGSTPKAQKLEPVGTQVQPSKDKVGQSSAVSRAQPGTGTDRLMLKGEVGWISEAEVVPVSSSLMPQNSPEAAQCQPSRTAFPPPVQ